MERLTVKGHITNQDIDELFNGENRECAYFTLCKYENDEEQGLLLHLPVPIGTNVYVIPDNIVFRKKYDCGGEDCEECGICLPAKNKFTYEMIPKFGKSVFSTYEDVMKKLIETK